jgi:transcriptional regulator with XRE-family HTH domain
VSRGRPAGVPGSHVDDPEVVSLRMRIARLRLPQAQLAPLAGLSTTMLSRLLTGRQRLDRAVELRLHRVLDVEEQAKEAADAVRRREYARDSAGPAPRDVSRPQMGAAS